MKLKKKRRLIENYCWYVAGVVVCEVSHVGLLIVSVVTIAVAVYLIQLWRDST